MIAGLAAAHRTRRRFASVAVGLGALLLALVTPVVAEAEPPEVTASENPVLIAYPHFTTKDITLTWDLGPSPPQANLIVTENGTQIHNQPLFSGTGTRPLTVTYDNTYTAQLVQTFGGAPLGAPLTITTDKPTGDMTCAQRCIKSIDVQPHGGWAQFAIKTSETAVITLEASTKPPNSDGTWSDPDDVISVGTVLPTDSYTPPLANLAANTTYHYVVRAHVQGHQQTKTGSFKTLTRRVDVTFDEIQMIDDSDGPVDGDCDCWFMLGVGDAGPMEFGSLSNQKSIGSDTTVNPNANASITDAGSEIWLRAKGWDDDEDFGEFCPVGVGAPPWVGSGDALNCLEWAGDEVLVSLSRQGPPFAPGDVDEQFTDSFTIKVSGELVYNVRGTYKVSYF